MNGWSESREVEKPRTITAKRALLIEDLKIKIVALKGQREALEVLYGRRSPEYHWLNEAWAGLTLAVEELERTRR